MSLVKAIKDWRFIFIKTDDKERLRKAISELFADYADKHILMAELRDDHSKANLKILKTNVILENQLIFIYAAEKPTDERKEVFDIITDIDCLEHDSFEQ